MHIQKINDGVHALYDTAGVHVGNFKWISGQWKFKAIGYDPSGHVVPGGGPLTDRHNSTFLHLDASVIRAQFFQD